MIDFFAADAEQPENNCVGAGTEITPKFWANQGAAGETCQGAAPGPNLLVNW